MNADAVRALAGSSGAIYAALSPYLNGVHRSPDAETSHPVDVSAAPAARASATTAAPAAPFLNPAIAGIAAQTPPPVSPVDSVLHGDSGLLVQSYGAVALISGPATVSAHYGLRMQPAIQQAPAVAAYPPVRRIDYSV